MAKANNSNINATSKLFTSLQEQHKKLAKAPKQRKSNGNGARVAKYATQNVAIITAKIYKNNLCYDMQLAHNAKNDILVAIFGNAKAKLVKERCKAYAQRNNEQKQKNQSGKSVLLQNDIAKTLLANEQELAAHNVIVAHDIINATKAKLAKKQEQAKAKLAKKEQAQAKRKATLAKKQAKLATEQA